MKKAKTIRIDKRVLKDFRIALIKKYKTTHGYSYNEWNQAVRDRIEVLKNQLKTKDFSGDFDTDPNREHETTITIKIDDELLAEFRELVIKKYGKLRGNMYKEWNMAIRERTKKLEGPEETLIL